jgi:hypothetical protein
MRYLHRWKVYFRFLVKRRLVLLMMLLAFAGHAQERWLRVGAGKWNADTLLVDTLSLVPGSVEVWRGSNRVPDSAFVLVWGKGRLIRLPGKGLQQGEPLRIRYRAFPLDLGRMRYHRDGSKLETSEGLTRNPFTFTLEERAPETFRTDGLEKSGSIARGITFGNNQDVVVNSTLNLQLNGRLSDRIGITAAISDNNIPVQPEGNTQQLQEFDRVYIRLNDDRSQLTVGDFQLMKPEGYFLSLNKRGQGGWFQSAYPVGGVGGLQGATRAAVAVSRGKFARNVILGVERNQGPYRLKGADNEQFIQILANTERVYIDGELLKRGQDQDYVINYNTGDVTFTARRLITKDKRIVVEFQYSDKNYARSMTLLGQDFTWRGAQVRLNYFLEQDNKNKPILQELTDTQKLILAGVGDSLQSAVSESVDSVAYNGNEVLYEQRDTTVLGLLYPNVLVYSGNPARSYWKARFSLVGSGRGDYVVENTAANGKVFRWVAPIGGEKQGNYAPVVALISPKKRELFTLGVSKQGRYGREFMLEAAASNNDQNTFSDLDKGNDRGYGLRLKWRDQRPLAGNDSMGWRLISSVDAELVSHYFQYVERYRSTEFERDWNRTLSNDGIRGAQQMGDVGIGLAHGSNQALYRYSAFREQGQYLGQRHGVEARLLSGDWKLEENASWLTAADDRGGNDFLRQNLAAQAPLGKPLLLRITHLEERSRFRSANAETLLPASFHFRELGGRIVSKDTTRLNYELGYLRRDDWGARNEALVNSTLAHNYTAGFVATGKAGNRFRTTLNYRTLTILDSALTPTKKPENTVLVRFEYAFTAWKSLISANSFYEASSGLEVKKVFSYVEVAPGLGIYTWKDYNNNNIKELNEFEVAVFKDQARYIRVFTPTSEFVRTYNNQFNQIVTLNPAGLMQGKKSLWAKLLGKLYNQAAYRVDRKLANDPSAEAFLNPFQRNPSDSNMVTLNTSFRNTLSINRLDPVWGLDWFVQSNRNKSLLTNGFDERRQEFQGLRLRWNLQSKYTFNLEITQGVKASFSQFFPVRNFQIPYNEVKPEWVWQPSLQWRLALSYNRRDKINTLSEMRERALVQNAGAELKYSTPEKGTLIARFNYIELAYNGDANTPLGFEMLEALRVGANYTWNLSAQRSLGNNMQLNLSYDGRKSPGSPAIHTGGVQVRAYF